VIVPYSLKRVGQPSSAETAGHDGHAPTSAVCPTTIGRPKSTLNRPSQPPSVNDRAGWEQTFIDATCAPVDEIDKEPTFGPRDEIAAE
jgi:hypothetical protein